MSYYEHHLGDAADRARRSRRVRAQRMEAARSKGRHTDAQWVALLRHFNYRCLRCGCQPPTLQKDHIEPVYQGGSDAIDNLQPLCQRCNASKGPETTNWAAYRDARGFEDAA